MGLISDATDAAAAGSIAAKASGFSWAGAGASVVGWVTQIDLLTFVGVTVAVGGALVSWYFQRQRMALHRAQDKRQAELAAQAKHEGEIRQRNLLLDEQIKTLTKQELESRIAAHAGQDATK